MLSVLRIPRLGVWPRILGAALFLGLSVSGPVHAAGTLTPKGAVHAPIQIRDHRVKVVIDNGFARTEVRQTFFNPNDTNLEAIYSFPVPKSASLAEVTVFIGEQEIHGEVVRKQQARQVYEKERDKGNAAGLAEKNGYQDFSFAVSPVRAQGETGIRFVYYQPLPIDTGVGRYTYPLEDGGTDEVTPTFWDRNTKVEQAFTVDLELKSAWPVDDVRLPGFETEAKVTRVDAGHVTVHVDRKDGRLEKDLVFYYRLADNLPGRVELVPYRPHRDKPGTFMLVLTPGIDLKPLNRGADYTFVLDVSGSMAGKLPALARGVSRALGQLRSEDRFRIVLFETAARELTQGWQPATPEQVKAAIASVGELRVGGSTNLYDGLRLALSDLNADRATSLVLVTDGVTNTGEVNPAVFHKLMKQYDVRVFGFLMGNSANWPLMRTICDASGGFYAAVSNQDDIAGQILLAKSKLTHECLHDAAVKFSGTKVFETTEGTVGKVYFGQQLVIFGRYEKAGPVTVTLKARLTGEDKTYTATFNLPELDTANPELERLWALDRIEAVEAKANAGQMPEAEADQAVADLGVAYQLVTDQTSMLVLSDQGFTEHGIGRNNKARVALERQAQDARQTAPIRNHQVDAQRPAFSGRSHALRGGGAMDPWTALLACALGLLALVTLRKPTMESKER